MGGDFQHGLCGCFDDLGICLLTYFVPCFTFGQAAEAVGESCILCGILALTPANICVIPLVRSKIRDAQGIDGSLVMDFLTTCFCGFCVITQMAMEAKQMSPRSLDMERE